MRVTLWMRDRPIRALIESLLIENDYDVNLVNDRSSTFDEDEALKNSRLLILEMDVFINQAQNIMPLLEKIRGLNNCKVLILSKPEYYPMIRNNELNVDRLADHIISLPLDEDELLGNVERYLND